MCVDYTNLNRACPKDYYPLPRIDQLVDATSGYELLTFLDAYSGYNQIRMAPADQENTAFITDRGIYCYKVMPFGLKNAGATYQRMVDKLFRRQIGRNMEIYVDDMIVKSKTAEAHLADLAETFQTLRRFHMRLNPAKCVFGVSSGRFLGFVIHQSGIDANPEKVRAITRMHSPRSVKEVQCLTGKLAALSRFISRSGDRCLPFFQALQQVNNFTWTPECEEAFEDLKAYLTRLPRLASPEPGETLGLYLAASARAVSSALVREAPPKQQPIYYVSHVLAGAEARYPPHRKAGSGVEGRKDADRAWTLHVDGSTITGVAGVGLILKSPTGETYERSVRLQFQATNNEAEYEALLHGLRLALEMQVDNLEVFNDSQLVTGHVNGSYEARDPTMASYLAETQRLARLFSRFSITQVPRAQNASADALAKAASARGLEKASVTEPITASTIPSCGVVETRTSPNWMEEILCFKSDGEEPDDPAAARRLRRTQTWYSLVGGKLYRRGFSQPLLLCLAPPEAHTVLAELHEGICGEHIGGRTLAFKALRQGYYWPTMRRDAAAYVRQCQPCQRHARLQHQPAVPLNSMEIAWPFAQWGLDLLGPFPPASGQ
ncbi:uncharacterized protein LOC135651428 [Musa acuminata AAA Group]|uniref:uncharacterized protein LOC135651428 n=1 Tax=Musa acuminata AAA Group TaxID=214697 RepID=UPI0031D511D6